MANQLRLLREPFKRFEKSLFIQLLPVLVARDNVVLFVLVIVREIALIIVILIALMLVAQIALQCV